jgi:hypothetical protein
MKGLRVKFARACLVAVVPTAVAALAGSAVLQGAEAQPDALADAVTKVGKPSGLDCTDYVLRVLKEKGWTLQRS